MAGGGKAAAGPNGCRGVGADHAPAAPGWDMPLETVLEAVFVRGQSEDDVCYNVHPKLPTMKTAIEAYLWGVEGPPDGLITGRWTQCEVTKALRAPKGDWKCGVYNQNSFRGCTRLKVKQPGPAKRKRAVADDDD